MGKGVLLSIPVVLTGLAPAPAAADEGGRAPASAPATVEPGGRPPPRVRVPRTLTPPVIDGRLDDPAWRDAAVITDFRQVQPIEGGVPTERTEARICYDDDAVYVAVRCFDAEPHLILGRQLQRDGDLGSDDQVTVAFDTFLDRRNGYLFETGPAGARRDGLIEAGGGNVRMDWDGIWFLKTRVDDQGWVVEMALPAKTISFDPRAPGWGFNVGRTIRRKQEVVRWSGGRSNVSVRNVGEAGVIEGIAGLEQGVGLTLRPYLVFEADLNSGDDPEVEPSFDAFYRITPSVTAALTFNTDFAEAEVDERQVNLTRFPLFFPEKRDFFLQDAGIFSFGGIGSSPLPFFSRRIGIVDGEPKDILAGVKVTGRQDRLNFGLLNVQMAEDEDLGWKNLTVVRPQVNVLDQSTAGAIFTHGDPDAAGNDNTLGGVDFVFRTGRLGDSDRTLTGNAYLMGTESADDDRETDTAFGFGVGYPNEDPWSWSFSTEQTGSDFDPGLGFVSRRGVREYYGRAAYEWLPHRAVVYEVDASTQVNVITNLDDKLETIDYDAVDVSIGNQIGDGVSVGVDVSREVLTEPFDIQPGITIPAGDYTFGGPSVSAYTSGVRPLLVYASFAPTSYYGGYRADYGAGLTWRPSPHFLASADYDLNDIDLDQGSFNVHVARVRGNVYFSPSLSWQNLVQWDNLSQLLGFNSRIRWELEPGRDAFVVLNHGSDVSDEQSWTTVGSEVTVKVGLTFRY